MDENGKRKRIEVTDDERVDYMAMDTTETPETDSFEDDTAPAVEFDSPQNDDEEKVVTIESALEGLDEQNSDEGSGDTLATEAPTSESSLEDDAADTMETAPEPAETVMVETEIEPETVATSQVEQEPATIADRPSAFQSSNDPAEAPVAMPAAIDSVSAAATINKKRLLIIAAAAGALIVLAILSWWLMAGKKDTPAPTEQNDTTVTMPVEQPKLGIAATITEGVVEFMRGDDSWQAMTTATQLSEGDSVRTGKDSRAVLTLDDGSAIRLDANTSIKLTSLTANQVQVEHLEGIAYSRVVPSSDRTYTVTAGEATYRALGTAFTTVNTETTNGVQVFESSVQVNGSTDAVVEGKQFYQANSDEALEGVVSTLDIDALVKDSFVNWNMSLDERDSAFKERLGVLTQIKERAQALKKKATEAAKLKAEQEAAKKAAEEKAAKESESRSGQSTRVMTLEAGENNLLEWIYLGKPTNGYKLVYSKNNRSPVFKTGSGSDRDIYISSNSQTSARLPSNLTGEYYVRVCAYTKDSTCIDYSNVVTIDI